MLETIIKKSTKIFKRPVLIITVSVLLTVFFGYGISKIEIDNNIRSMLPRDNEEKAVNEYYENLKRFGNNDFIVIGVQNTALPKEADAESFENIIISKITDNKDKKFVNKFYKENNGRYFLKEKISGKDKIRLIQIYESIGIKGNIYSLPVIKYVYDLRNQIEKMGSEIQLEYFSKTFGVSSDDAKSIAGLILQSGFDKNKQKELKELLANKDKLVNEFFIDESLAEKIIKVPFNKLNLTEILDYSFEPIKKIDDITSVDFMENIKDELQVKKIIPGIDKDGITEDNIKILPSRVASWEMYQNGIVSNDETVTSILIQLKNNNIKVKTNIINKIQKILEENKKDNIETYLDGEPIIDDSIAEYIMMDVKILLPLVMIVIIMILFFCFKNLEGVLYPALVMILSIIWAVGIMAFCRVPLNLISTIMPVLLVAISSAYAIHQMNHYFLDHSHDKMDIINRNMGVVGLGVLMSGLAVMIGFGALAAEKFVPIRNFGIFTAIGDFFAVLIALFLLPAILLVSRKPKKSFLHESRKDFVGKMLNLFVKINKNYSKEIVIASVALAIIFGIGTFFMKSELNTILFFKKDAPIRIADDYLNEKLAGTEMLNIVIDSDFTPILEREKKDNSANETNIVEIATPEILTEIEKFEKDIKNEFPVIQKVVSLNNYIKKINQEMNGSGNPEYYKTPDTKELISQYLLIFSGDVSSVVTTNHDKLRIAMNLKRTDTSEIKRIKDYCDKYFTKDFKEKNHIQVNVVGGGLLYWVANSLLVEGQIISIVLCMLIVFILLFIVFRSIVMSLIALIPNVITILINFGVLGFFNIPLNVGTAMVSSIAIGIGVDYAIHYMTWYRLEIEKHKNIEIALKETIMHKGRAILYNMLVIFGGFLVLVTSKFVPLIQFGALVALCMLTTAFGALIIIPAVMNLLSKKDYKFLYMRTK